MVLNYRDIDCYVYLFITLVSIRLCQSRLGDDNSNSCHGPAGYFERLPLDPHVDCLHYIGSRGRGLSIAPTFSIAGHPFVDMEAAAIELGRLLRHGRCSLLLWVVVHTKSYII